MSILIYTSQFIDPKSIYLFRSLIITIVFCWIYYRWKNRDLYRLSKKLPCTLEWVPILGHAKHFAGNGFEAQAFLSMLKEMYEAPRGLNADRRVFVIRLDCMSTIKRLGRDSYNSDGLISVWIANMFYIFVCQAEALEMIAKRNLNKEFQFLVKPLIGNGSLYAPVPVWRPKRKKISKFFGQRIIYNFVQIFSKQSKTMVNKLHERVDNGNFSIFEYVMAYALDSVCATTMGVEMNVQNKTDNQVFEAFKGFCETVTYRLFRPWLHPEMFFKFSPIYTIQMKHAKFLKDFVYKVIKLNRGQKIMGINHNGITHKRDHAVEDKSKTRTFLDLYMECSDNMDTDTDEELNEETLTLMLAGSDTTATGISFAALILAKYTEIQDKAFEEIKETLGNSDEPINVDDLLKLKFLDIVIKETLRLYPPVPVIARKLDKPLDLPSGITLISGTKILLNIWALHRNPKYWGNDADMFRPERFFDSPPTHTAAFIPFSYGPRNCVGYQYAMLSMKVVLVTLLRNFRLLPPRNTDGSIKDYFLNKEDSFPVSYGVMIKHRDNFEIRLEHRCCNSRKL